jgi:hypothetical protein
METVDEKNNSPSNDKDSVTVSRLINYYHTTKNINLEYRFQKIDPIYVMTLLQSPESSKIPVDQLVDFLIENHKPTFADKIGYLIHYKCFQVHNSLEEHIEKIINGITDKELQIRLSNYIAITSNQESTNTYAGMSIVNLAYELMLDGEYNVYNTSNISGIINKFPVYLNEALDMQDLKDE